MTGLTAREHAAWWAEEARYWLRRRASRTWVRWLLFEPGQGWLRWSTDLSESCPSSYYEPPEPYTVAPPARRLVMAVRYRARWPFALRDDDRRRHAAW